VSFYSTVCVFHVVVNKITSRSGISSPDEFLVTRHGISTVKRYCGQTCILLLQISSATITPNIVKIGQHLTV